MQDAYLGAESTGSLDDFTNPNCGPRCVRVDSVCSLDLNQALPDQPLLPVPFHRELEQLACCRESFFLETVGDIDPQLGTPWQPRRSCSRAGTRLPPVALPIPLFTQSRHPSQEMAHPSGGMVCCLQSRLAESPAVVASSGVVQVFMRGEKLHSREPPERGRLGGRIIANLLPRS